MMNRIFGWNEWVALPALGLGAVRAKIDTGARTSVLHALETEPFGRIERPQLRFTVHPVPGRADLAVLCSADWVCRREITASNGRSEVRPVVRTAVMIGEVRREVEISLTNRDALTYPMLLGREALKAFDALVDPSRAELQLPQPRAAEERFARRADWASKTP